MFKYCLSLLITLFLENQKKNSKKNIFYNDVADYLQRIKE